MAKSKKQTKNKDSIFNDGGIQLHLSQARFPFLSYFTNLKNKWRIIKNFKSIKTVRILFSLLLVLAIIGQLNFTFLEDRVVWKTSIYKIQIGGENKTNIEQRLEIIYGEYLKKKITFSVGTNLYGITAEDLGINFNIEDLLNNILQKGHSGNFTNDFITRTKSSFIKDEYPISIRVDQNVLQNTLERLIPELENKPVDANVEFRNGQFVIVPSKDGVTTNYTKIANILEKNAQELILAPINIDITKAFPEISDTKAENALNQAKSYIDKKVFFNAKILDKHFEFKMKDHLDFIRFSKVINPISKQKIFVADIDPKKLGHYLEENISSQIDVARKDTQININENLDITANGITADGYELNILNSIEKIRNNLDLDEYSENIDLSIDIDKGQIIQPEDINSGITEFLAFGESAFGGSPNNRKHNIDTAMKRFQNIVVLPGEEFSFNNRLGPVNANTGYKKELVIKEGGKQTIAEYGGGVCQVSTTLFRAILNAGLNITSRRSHSYKVVYYNPDGLDATIYPPTVDFKFKNDTLSPILIQNSLDQEKSIAKFFIYGTSDGRKIELDGPHRYAFKYKPKEPVIQYVPSKPASFRKKKRGHNGFKTYWIRKIYKLDEEPVEEYFYSVYKAIPDKIQIGGEKPVISD